jgi:threonine aldolase
VGSVLCGSRDFISRAHRIRKMVGGGMRQAGILAAAGTYALDHHVERLSHDHALARRLAAGLADLPGLQVEMPQTNILFVDLVGLAKDQSAELILFLKERGILATGLYRLRFVTHLDVDAEGIDRVIHAASEFFAEKIF